jgi:hypothetical protein
MVKYNNFRAVQELEVVSAYTLEGDFDSVFNQFTELKERVTGWRETAMKTHGSFVDGAKTKTVRFDKVFIEWHDVPYGDGEKELHVMGERDVDASERAAIEKQQQISQQTKDEYEKREFDRLSKKFAAK